MKLVIPGGSGHVGRVVASAFATEGHDVVVLSRTPRGDSKRRLAARSEPQASEVHSDERRLAARSEPQASEVHRDKRRLAARSEAKSAEPSEVHWDGRTLGPWARELEGADVVLNLAGHSVDCRYTPANRARMLDSRLDSTRAVGAAIAQCTLPPRVWLQASTATIYAHTFGAAHDETGALGGSEPAAPDTWRFSIEVATRWERTLAEAETPRTRKLALRSAMTMSPARGGVFAVLSRLARLGLGGPVAGGKQYVSWIHQDDFIAALRFLIAREEISGAVNLAAPNPLPYAEFMRTLRREWGMPLGLPASAWMLEIAAFVLRTESELVLKSRRVVPGRLLQAGFSFTHPAWPAAARDLVMRARADTNH